MPFVTFDNKSSTLKLSDQFMEIVILYCKESLILKASLSVCMWYIETYLKPMSDQKGVYFSVYVHV